ncbi:hypothetical protein OJ253_354 [Cryptosporidium canis]|uniref:Signal recognition particle subunit SRP14 n=1 Tax=Cryptosporidium canis TaxID=195482 RepID=A0A9D5DJG0_9CRYT|nr:hypothetical protein OJ253_354 [Cryptosporidium canis]
MKELDANGFINELNSILKDEKNKKPVRITIKRYFPDVKGCKKKRKEIENKRISDGSEEYHNLVRVTDGKRRKSKVVIKNKSDSDSFVSDLIRSLIKIDTQKKGQKMNTK